MLSIRSVHSTEKVVDASTDCFPPENCYLLNLETERFLPKIRDKYKISGPKTEKQEKLLFSVCSEWKVDFLAMRMIVSGE